MYCRGNPIKYSDPSGYEPQAPCDRNPNWKSTEYEREKAIEALGVMKEAAEWGTLFVPGLEEVGAAKAGSLFLKFTSRKGAFKAAKRMLDVPVTEKPVLVKEIVWKEKTIKLPNKYAKQGRQYEFKNGANIRDDAWSHDDLPSHFNINVKGTNVHLIYGK